MALASQRPRSCHEHAEKLTLSLLVLGSLAVVVYAGDSFLSASEKVYHSNGKPLAILLLSSSVFVLIGAMIMIQAFAGWSCRSNDQSTVDPVDQDSWSYEWGWSQGHVLPVRRSSHQNPSEGSRCFIWASCTYQQLGADVSAFHTAYACGNHTLAKGSAVSILPAVPVVRSSTCVCCLEDFQPGSAIAVLKCGHTFHKKCIESWVLSGSSAAGACPVCRESLELRTV
ncbi:ATL73 [Symbiodinium sp. CCMP2456]|nr:ATL73 [Symbiodinium sp. CCMP2456]